MQNNLNYQQKIIERKPIKTATNCIGGAFLLGEGIVLVLQFALIFVFSLFSKTEILSDDGFSWMLQIALSTIMFTIPFAIMCYPMGTSPARCCAFGKHEKGTLLPLVLIGLAVCMVANLLGGIFSSVFGAIGIESQSAEFQSDILKGWYFPVISIIGGAILPALIEEFALRGVVLGSLRRYGNNFAIIVSAILFGIMHGNLEQIPFAFVLGLYFGFITIKTGTVWAAVLLHFINNAFAFFFDIIANWLGNNMQTLINYTYFVVMILLGFIGVGLSYKKDLFKLQPDEKSALTLGDKLGVFASSPCIAIYVGFIIFKMVLQGLMV